jgi:hypothetical protein
MSLLWPHRVVVFLPGGGASGAFNEQDEWVPESGETPEVLYSGAANVDDKGRVLEYAVRSVGGQVMAGLPTVKSDAICYLRKKNAAGRIPEGAVVHVDWKDGTTSDAVVMGHRRRDNSLDLRRV